MDERERNRFYNQERDRFWNRDDMKSREGRDRDHRDWGSRERQQHMPSRNLGYGGFEPSSGYPGPFGWAHDPDVDRDFNPDRDRERHYEGSRNYGQRDERSGHRSYGYPAQRYDRDEYRGYQGESRGYQGESRGSERGREHESFGQQLREGAQNIVRKVKRAFRGPKGYKRSDERIREDVNDRLAQQDHFDPSEIEVQVANGEVTLTGTVRHRHEKFLAEEIADDVSGVGDVHNQLRVQREPTTPGIGGSADTSQSTGTPAGTEAARNRNARA